MARSRLKSGFDRYGNRINNLNYVPDQANGNSSFIPVTNRNKRTNLRIVDIEPRPKLTTNWVENVQRYYGINSVFGTYSVNLQYTIASLDSVYKTITITGSSPTKKFGINLVALENYPMLGCSFSWSGGRNIFVKPYGLKLHYSQIKEFYKANQCKFREKLNNLYTRWMARNLGKEIDYNSLKEIKEPVVICYYYKNSLRPDKTRILYPDGFCFVHYSGVLTDFKGFDDPIIGNRFGRSCFSELATSLIDCVERMKQNDSDSLTIRKIYTYTGIKHKYHSEQYRCNIKGELYERN